MTTKHFVALVPMDGQHQGKIGQHYTMQYTISDAKKWAANRFSRPFVIVEMPDGLLSLSTEAALAEYNNVMNPPLTGKQIKCAVETRYRLTFGKIYDVIQEGDIFFKIKDDRGFITLHDKDLFCDVNSL